VCACACARMTHDIHFERYKAEILSLTVIVTRLTGSINRFL